MMHSSPGSDSGNRLNIELNLVPFIDLLSTLVLFLLVTTVWLQVSILPVSPSLQGEKQTETVKDTPHYLRIHLSSQALSVRLPDQSEREILNVASAYNFTELNKLLAETLRNPVAQASVSASEEVEYRFVIETIDVARAAGIENVGISVD